MLPLRASEPYLTEFRYSDIERKRSLTVLSPCEIRGGEGGERRAGQDGAFDCFLADGVFIADGSVVLVGKLA